MTAPPSSGDLGDDAPHLAELWARLGVPQYAIARTFLDSIEEGALVQDSNGTALWCTAAASRILGLSIDELYGRTSVDPRWRAITVDGDPLPGEQHPPMVTLTTGQEFDGFVMGVARPDGDRRWLAVSTRALRKEDGEMAGVISIFRDITALHAVRQRARTLMMFAPIGIGAMDSSGTVVTCNDHLTETVGVDLVGARPSEVIRNVHPAYQAQLEAAFDGVLDATGPTDFDVEAPVDVVGVNRWLRFRGTPVRNGDTVDGCVFTVEDVHDARVGAEALEYRARHDALTGLVNRGQLEARLRELTAAPGAHTAVLLVDLDGFKEINDTLGHGFGDQLLRSVAVRLRMACRSADLVARMGGDEFAVVIAAAADGEPQRFAERILQVMAQPFGLDDRTLHVGASIGIAVQEQGAHPEDGVIAGLELLREADLALYAAKAKGRNRFALYDRAMSDASIRRFAIRSALTTPDNTNEFTVVYKPVVRLATGSVDGFDALIRWESDRLGVVSAAEFIPVAEETGDIRRLGIHLLDASIDALTALQATIGDARELAMALSISHQNLDNPSFLDDVAAVVRAHRVDPRRLIAEISEQGLREHPVAGHALRSLAELGLRISIDDFGAAGAVESVARDFPVDIVKVDRRLVRLLDTDERRAKALLGSLADVAKALDLTSIAAGVETRRHLTVVQGLGFDAAQGFVFGQPLPRHETLEFLRCSVGVNLVDEL